MTVTAETVEVGSLVWIRSRTMRRSALAQVLAIFQVRGGDWANVRLLSDIADWDEMVIVEGGDVAKPVIQRQLDQVLTVEWWRLEAVRP